ncbi:unnamed protein product [Caenorhabditis auriculariae]|uniref:Uncharacterized protein n=1 Tax=Caenorhabditis auriculariae TaxID=2777116 RepID=A0A8S1GUD9_9PELO|nr:unnamed protein product [Caenorhabditis auriculariae]
MAWERESRTASASARMAMALHGSPVVRRLQLFCKDKALSIRPRGCLAPDTYVLAALMAFKSVWRVTVRCVIGFWPQQKSQEIF